VPTGPNAGRSLVTRRAIVDIVRNATLGSYGVTGFTGSLAKRMLGRLGAGQPGIRVSLEPPLAVDLDITVARGVPIAEVARQLDSAVRYAVRRSLGVELARLTIHVDGLRVRPTAQRRPTAMDDVPHVTDLAGSGTDVA
jgi:uncharacterized alkaline shock family protein YloU